MLTSNLGSVRNERRHSPLGGCFFLDGLSKVPLLHRCSICNRLRSCSSRECCLLKVQRIMQMFWLSAGLLVSVTLPYSASAASAIGCGVAVADDVACLESAVDHTDVFACPPVFGLGWMTVCGLARLVTTGARWYGQGPDHLELFVASKMFGCWNTWPAVR